MESKIKPIDVYERETKEILEAYDAIQHSERSAMEAKLREQAPVHYRLPKGGELIDVIGHLPFSRASAIKYIYRAGKKDGATPSVVDLRKARRCLDLEIERMERMGEQG